MTDPVRDLQRNRRLTGVAAGAALGVALLAACVDGASVPGSTTASATSARSPTSSLPSSQSPGASAASALVPEWLRHFRSTRRSGQVAVPVRIRIPSIGVNSGLERLTRRGDGTIGVPVAWDRAGWYVGGPRPGEAGGAVILGHVDSPTGAAVFARLHDLRRGDRIQLSRADGSHVSFVVDRLEQHERRRFPVIEVYWPTLHPELRLITCGGSYDRSAGGYQSNVIVFASAASGHTP